MRKKPNRRLFSSRNLAPLPSRPLLGTAPSCALTVAISAVLGFGAFSIPQQASAVDILRSRVGGVRSAGGGASKSASNGTPNGPESAAAAAQAALNSRRNLERTTNAIQAVKNMQAVARANAIKGGNNAGTYKGLKLPDVPNGLGKGGLQVAAGVPKNLAAPQPGENPALWRGATLPTQKDVRGQTIVSIKQTSQSAVLNWETFNVGKKTTLQFDQSAGGNRRSEWIAFNKVNDPSGRPSQILGKIEADGQVYVINRNGIMFGGSAQTNTRALVASTLPINDNLIANGLLNNNNAEFLFSGLTTAADPDFTLTGGVTSVTLSQPLLLNRDRSPVRTPQFSYAVDGTTRFLTPGTHYTVAVDPATRKATITFTPEGIAAVGALPVSSLYTPETSRVGDIVVQPGARLTTPAARDGNGGRVMLVGANVEQRGTISTPAGQTILAAGLQVGINAHPSNDPTLRGLDVWVGAVADYAGDANNRGIIESLEGSTTVTGRTIRQMGVIESSTSVALNGRIDLRASYDAVSNPRFLSEAGTPTQPVFLNQRTGSLVLGEGSVTRILPDYESESKIPGTVLPARSQMNFEGLSIHLDNEAMVLAPNGIINGRAGTWAYRDADGNRSTNLISGEAEPYLGSRVLGADRQRFLLSTGQIYVDSGAFVSVAGTPEALVPLTNNIVDVEFRSAEFADSPLQRDGILRAIPLTIDLRRSGIYGGRYWVGTPLGDATGFAALIERDAAQLTAVGGTIDFSAGGSIVVQNGATLDVSGGYFKHEEGFVQTSRLYRDGRLIDIAQAAPDQIYDGIFTGQTTMTSAKWGVSQTYVMPFMTGLRFQPSYIEGADGGSLILRAPGMALDGQLLGRTVQGPRERSAPPRGGSLSIDFSAEAEISFAGGAPQFVQTAPTSPQVLFRREARQSSAAPFELTLAGEPVPLSSVRTGLVILSPDLLEEEEGGFASLTVENTEGDITVEKGIALVAPPFGRIRLAGANVNIQGEVTAPSGTLELVAYNLSPAFVQQDDILRPPGANATVPARPGKGSFVLGNEASLSTAGLIVDDRFGSERETIAIDGGDITIQAYRADMAAGSMVDVSGGVAVDIYGDINYGDGGDLAIITGENPIGSNLAFDTTRLVLGSTLRGYSGATGGSLTIQASLIQIGGIAQHPDTLLLQPSFFRTGGFTSYSLTGIGAPAGPLTDSRIDDYFPAIAVAPGTQIDPVAESWRAIPYFGETEGVRLEATLLPAELRSPTSIELIAQGADDTRSSGNLVIEARGDLVFGQGARISTDPGASVGLVGQTVSIHGSVFAPGGRITIAGDDEFPTPAGAESLRVTTFIADGVQLSAAGTALMRTDVFGRRTGQVFSGGTVEVAGNIAAGAGVLIDVSGASAELDFHPTALGRVDSPLAAMMSTLNGAPFGLGRTAVTIDSNGGLISLQGGQMLYSDAQLRGFAGGPTATGGALEVLSGSFQPIDSTQSNLLVRQHGLTLSSRNARIGVGTRLVDGSGAQARGIGNFTVDRFAEGGFDSLLLGGNVEFRGPITLRVPVALSVASREVQGKDFGIIRADSSVLLSARHVELGRPFVAPLAPEDVQDSFFESPLVPDLKFLPVSGTGRITVQAELIDVGTAIFSNIGKVSLLADGGEIRGNGNLLLSGDLLMRAAQIYPTTLSTFNIFAYGQNGSVTIQQSGTLPAPLSVGGVLNIFAASISQGGTLRAPLGTIQLGWDGTDFNPATSAFDQPSNPIAPAPNPQDPATATPTSQRVVLRRGSNTSVAMEGLGGLDIPIPFGISPDGSSWIDPRGVDVTVQGLPQKRILIQGENVTTQAGSVVDIQGGGDLYAYRFVPGAGGSVDLLGTPSAGWDGDATYQPGDLVSFNGQTWSARVRHSGETPEIGAFWTQVRESYAIIPGFRSDFAPFAPFNTGINATALEGDPGLVSNSLRLGDRIYLDGNKQLEAGYYTLLPRRYALLPGAFLVTPSEGAPLGAVTLVDGSSFVSGFQINQFDRPVDLSPLRQRFELNSFETIRERVAYSDFVGNTFFMDAAARLEIPRVQRLPVDSGYALFHGNTGLNPDGVVRTGHPDGGRGALIDLSSFADIHVIGGSGAAPTGATAVIKAGVVNSWGAESIFVGGIRRAVGSGSFTLDVRTDNLFVNTPGSVFLAPDLTLAATSTVNILAGSRVEVFGSVTERAAQYSLVGDGALLRVSADFSADTLRTGVSGTVDPNDLIPAALNIGAGTRIAGSGVLLDSSYASSIDPGANLQASALTLGSGQISILFDPAANLIGSEVPNHLVLSGDLLQDVQQARALTLRSYRTIDTYGVGSFGSTQLRNLSLAAAGIRGFEQGGGSVEFRAQQVSLANPSNVTNLSAPAALTGNLTINAGIVRLGANRFAVAGFDSFNINATGGLLGTGHAANGVAPLLSTQGDMTISTPLIAGTGGASHTLAALNGDLLIERVEGRAAVRSGLGASFAFQGQTIVANADIILPSGQITLTASGDPANGGAGFGDVTVGGRLDVSGTAKSFYDLIRFSDAGRIVIESQLGDVSLLAGSQVSVASAATGGDAGFLEIKASRGVFDAAPDVVLDGHARAGWDAGSFALDTSTLADFTTLSGELQEGGFTHALNVRVRTGDVLIGNSAVGAHVARDFTVSADTGNIVVTGEINVSADATGRATAGKIVLAAGGNLTLADGSVLNAHAREFSAAGKGGEIRLEAGVTHQGVANTSAFLNLADGSTIDLGVDAFVAGRYTEVGSSAHRGQFTGTLHLRAPRNAANTDFNLGAIEGTILGASSIVAEGFNVLQPANGLITGWRSTPTSAPAAGTTQRLVYDSAQAFMSNHDAMATRLLGAGGQNLMPTLVIAPGAELVNPNGSLTIGRENSTALGSSTSNSGDWNLGDFRFGPKNAAGVLTLRARDNVVLYNALSDGFFGAGAGGTIAAGQSLWLSKPIDINENLPAGYTAGDPLPDNYLPVNTQSWSFRIAAGSDLGAADFRQVQGAGSLHLGKFYAPVLGSGVSTSTATQITNRYQVIRTGTGDIDIATGGDVQLRNQFATIYTAGAAIPTATNLFANNDFVVPRVPNTSGNYPGNGLAELGPAQQLYRAYYTMAGGDLSIDAGGNIGRYTLINSQLVKDSSRQTPTNWLYRRGMVDPGTGVFGSINIGQVTTTYSDPTASTTWWIDFSNFFEGVGALGGGDVTLNAGSDVSNVDAVIPTNARMAGREAVTFDANGNPLTYRNIAPDASRLLELGGGDLVVRAGENIDAGIYYVERGHGDLFAGDSIITNETRSPSTGRLSATPNYTDAKSWLPTTLMLGKSQFDVSARGDILLGPAANPFLLPQGIANNYWYKTYFTTYSADAAVNVTSYGGDVTHRFDTAVSVDSANPSQATLLQRWYDQLTSPNVAAKPSFFQPWIRLAETGVAFFDTALTLNTPTLKSTAFSGDIAMVGRATLFPSATGTLELAAGGEISGLHPLATQGQRTVWSAAVINVSDTDPLGLPSIVTPLDYFQFAGNDLVALKSSTLSAIAFSDLNQRLTETGSFSGQSASITVKQALHSADVLHEDDAEPVRIYTQQGDISGMMLFSPKSARIHSANDLADVSLYVQNVGQEDYSVVSAARDVRPFNANTARRSLANDESLGNRVIAPVATDVNGVVTTALPGDIQISGPGVLEVFAGRDLDLGVGANLANGTGFGIVSIGNLRNPALPLEGADIIAFAGLKGVGNAGPALSLSRSALDFATFIDEYMAEGVTGTSAYMERLDRDGEDFENLTEEQQAIVALEEFYKTLRQAGRDFSETGAATAYDAGFAAIDTLFGESNPEGSIITRARDIRTSTGGTISLGVAGGGLTLASEITGNPLTPPGIVTEAGGAVSILTRDSVDIGLARIFTLRGGDMIIWSSEGDIAAGSAPKTVVTAPPTRVVIDVTSANVQTDLGGLATGGGIGVLASVAGVEPGDVDLIAPVGVVDAGDAGIRVTGNINIAATAVLNATNIQVGGATSGVPAAPVVAAPNIAGLTAASSAASGASSAAESVAKEAQQQSQKQDDEPSIITVEVIGYGGGSGESASAAPAPRTGEEERRRNDA